jgi:hypothetical protein
MKKLLYTIAFLGAVALVLPSHAQVSIQINIGSQPQWGPSGYDYARYYYMPEYDMYYDVQRGYYVYWDYNRMVPTPGCSIKIIGINITLILAIESKSTSGSITTEMLAIAIMENLKYDPV